VLLYTNEHNKTSENNPKEGKTMEKKKAIKTFKGKRVISGTLNRKKVEYIAGEILVVIEEEHRKLIQIEKEKERIRQALLRQLPKGAKILRDFNQLGRIKIGIPENADVTKLIKLLEKVPAVKYAEPNIVVETCQVVPNEYPNINALRASQWGLERVRAPWAWNNTTGSPSVLIAIVD
jgi:hypothetical protein